jgi:hypothetical protein
VHWWPTHGVVSQAPKCRCRSVAVAPDAVRPGRVVLAHCPKQWFAFALLVLGTPTSTPVEGVEALRCSFQTPAPPYDACHNVCSISGTY